MLPPRKYATSSWGIPSEINATSCWGVPSEINHNEKNICQIFLYCFAAFVDSVPGCCLFEAVVYLKLKNKGDWYALKLGMSDEDVKKKLIKFDRNFIKKLFWKSTSQELVPCTPEQKNKTLFFT